MYRVLLLAALTGPTINLPLPDAKIYFPGDNIPIDPRGGYFQHSGQTGHQTYHTKTSHTKGGGYESPIQWPPAASESSHPYDNPGKHGTFSSYGHNPHPHHLSYPSYSYGSSGSHQQAQPHTFHSQSHSYGSSQSHGLTDGSVEGQIEQVSHGNHVSGSLDSSTREEHRLQETGNHVAHDDRPAHAVAEMSHVSQHHESNFHQTDESARPMSEHFYGQAKNPSAADVAAEEHHIIQEIEELVGLTSAPEGIIKNPITQQQEIIREIKGLKDPYHEEHMREQDEESAAEGGLSHVNHESTIPPLRHNDRNPEESHLREVEAPMVKVTSDQGYQGAGHQTIHTEVHKSHHQSSHHPKSTPDPLDLMNVYNDFVQGDFKPGHAKEITQQPKKELKPEIKQAIDNIMREWEVIPENEGKPPPPPRNYKITKHVKVTTTTNNHPVIVHPSQTITKTIQTHTFQPSSSHHRQVVTHHINIAELLEQLRQLESSPHHRNVTWCEEKIKEFLTELKRKEESGIEIDQSVRENTLHHILTKDQTITKEFRQEMEHETSGGIEEPFVKKTIVELGRNEPTRPPSHWTEQKVENEEHSISTGNIPEGGPEDREEQKKNELHETKYETSEESQIVTVTPSPENVQPLEALSHQSHATSDNENHSASDDMDSHGSEPQSMTVVPIAPPQERPGKPEKDEFRGETERQDRPLPLGYKPRERSEEENDIENVHSPVGEPKIDHNQIDELSIELPQNEFSREEGKETEQKSIENPNIEREETDEESHRPQEEHVIHELNTDDHSVGKTEYVVESEHQQTGESNGHSGSSTTTEAVAHHSEGSEGHSGGSRTEQVAETVEHTGGHGHSESVLNTEYVEETVHHSSGGNHDQSGGGSQTEYVEETVEHHNNAGTNVINYDQLIEELISLESLPGHQAIDKCEEKIRHFLEVLRKQQERGFDQNQAELQRLRLLLEEIQLQKQNQHDNGVSPHNPEASNSFWKKIGRKIKTTFEKAKTKAHDTVNGMMQ